MENSFEEETVLSVGDPVELHGLQRTELNGQRGIIVKINVTSDVVATRYGVKLKGVSEPKSIKLTNLHRTDCYPMPSEFMETTVGTPIFKMLLQFIPVKCLLALSACQVALRTEVISADLAWERLITECHGGNVDTARCRFNTTLSPFKIFAQLARLSRTLGDVEVVLGDLRDASDMGVEAVVCPAVSSLQPYGPAARAIFEKAGPKLTEYIQTNFHPRELQPGETYWTPGFDLGVHGLVHAMGPTRRTPHADQKMHDVYEAALATVLEQGYQSVAFGSISTGGNGVPAEIAAQIAVEEVRTAFARHANRQTLRIVIMAFEEEIQEAFQSAFAQIRRRVNENRLEILPLIVLDSMLPKQRLSFNTSQVPVAVHSDCDRFAMVGMDQSSLSSSGTLPFGVEVHVSKRSTVGGITHLEVVGGRCFKIPGALNGEGLTDGHGRQYFCASVCWIDYENDATDEPSGLQGGQTLSMSRQLEPLVDKWLGLVRGGRERQPNQMDMILEHLGPMPPANKLTERAMWVAALINPLPGLGVAWEIRPSMLAANSRERRLEIATKGIRESIANLDGTRPMRSQR